MKILGIDPGTGRTGWGVIIKEESHKVSSKPPFGSLLYVAHGCIVTTPEDGTAQRLLILHDKLLALIEEYSPDCVIVENIFFGRNAKTAIGVSQARGVIMLSAAKHKLPIHEYTSVTVKKSLSGSGKTEKKDVQKKVREILNVDIGKLAFNGHDKDFDDSADALAIAIHHAIR